MRPSVKYCQAIVWWHSAYCAFRAVGGAVALLHDDGRGLGIAHGRDM